MPRTFDLEIERESDNDGEAVMEIFVTYQVTSWGCSAQTYGPPENCYPAEPIEYDILSADTPFGPVVLRESEIELVEQDAYEMLADAANDYYDDY